MRNLMIICFILFSSVCFAQKDKKDMPTDPFQFTATRALQGAYGKIPAWKYDWYAKGLKEGIKCTGVAYVTSYGLWDVAPKADALYAADPSYHGLLCEDVCAADKTLPFGTVIWADGELRVVRDRGGAVTVARAKGHNKANTHNFDFWTKKVDEHYKSSTPYAIIGRAK